MFAGVGALGLEPMATRRPEVSHHAWQGSQEVLLSLGRCEAATSHTASPMIKKTICGTPLITRQGLGVHFPRTHPQHAWSLELQETRHLRPNPTHPIGYAAGTCGFDWLKLVGAVLPTGDCWVWNLGNPSKVYIKGGKAVSSFKGFTGSMT